MAIVEELHMRLNEYEKGALDFIQMKYSGISRNAAAKTCLRAMAIQLGYASFAEYQDLCLEDIVDAT